MKHEETMLILQAMHFAADKHRHQRRKDAEASPYINHPIAVAETLCAVGLVHDPVTLIAGILHDTIEDTETTGAELELRFGHEIRTVVEEVTDDKSLPPPMRKQLQIEHASHASERARLVKLADKICNLRDIVHAPPAGWSVERRRRYINWALAVVNEIRGTNADLESRFDELYAEADEYLARAPAI